MDFPHGAKLGLTLIDLVCETADRLSSSFPNYPVRVDGQQEVRLDGDYLYVTVEVASMLGEGRRPRELCVATAALPQDLRAPLAGGIQQGREPGRKPRLGEGPPADQLRDRLREALIRFIYRGHNVAYVDPEAVDSDRVFLTPEEALDAAVVHSNGTRRASGLKRGSGVAYEAVRSGAGVTSVRRKQPEGRSIPVPAGEVLPGVVWKPEQR